MLKLGLNLDWRETVKVQQLLPDQSEIVNSFPSPECSHAAVPVLGTEPIALHQTKRHFSLC